MEHHIEISMEIYTPLFDRRHSHLRVSSVCRQDLIKILNHSNPSNDFPRPPEYWHVEVQLSGRHSQRRTCLLPAQQLGARLIKAYNVAVSHHITRQQRLRLGHYLRVDMRKVVRYLLLAACCSLVCSMQQTCAAPPVPMLLCVANMSRALRFSRFGCCGCRLVLLSLRRPDMTCSSHKLSLLLRLMAARKLTTACAVSCLT